MKLCTVERIDEVRTNAVRRAGGKSATMIDDGRQWYEALVC